MIVVSTYLHLKLMTSHPFQGLRIYQSQDASPEKPNNLKWVGQLQLIANIQIHQQLFTEPDKTITTKYIVHKKHLPNNLNWVGQLELTANIHITQQV